MRWREGHGEGVRPWGFSPALSPPDETALVGRGARRGGEKPANLEV